MQALPATSVERLQLMAATQRQGGSRGRGAAESEASFGRLEVSCCLLHHFTARPSECTLSN